MFHSLSPLHNRGGEQNAALQPECKSVSVNAASKATTGPIFSPGRSIDARNARDLATLERVRVVVDDCLHAIAFIQPLEHPDSRWHPDDLRWALRGTMRDLTAELTRITQAALDVPDDADITAGIRDE